MTEVAIFGPNIFCMTGFLGLPKRLEQCSTLVYELYFFLFSTEAILSLVYVLIYCPVCDGDARCGLEVRLIVLKVTRGAPRAYLTQTQKSGGGGG